MRARWALLIAGAFLVLAVALLFVASSQPLRIGVSFLGQTNNGASYLVQITNGSREPQAFLAWIEPIAQGPGTERASETYGPAIPCRNSHTFALDRPADTSGKRRIVVLCYPANDTTWKRWLIAAKMSIGLQRSKAYKVYLDLPE